MLERGGGGGAIILSCSNYSATAKVKMPSVHNDYLGFFVKGKAKEWLCCKV